MNNSVKESEKSADSQEDQEREAPSVAESALNVRRRLYSQKMRACHRRTR